MSEYLGASASPPSTPLPLGAGRGFIIYSILDHDGKI